MYIIRIWEGLGNQMFQYAYALAVRQRTGQRVYIDTERAYHSSFELESRNVTRAYMLDQFNISIPKIEIESNKHFDFLEQRTSGHKIKFWLSRKGMFPIRFITDYKEQSVYHDKFFRSRGNYYAMGWFQNEQYFAGIRNALLKEFMPISPIRISIDYRQIIERDNSVAIHIRRGDYVKKGHACSVKYYLRAMQYISQIVPNPYYVFFSDNINWTKKTFGEMENTLFINEKGQYADYEELLLMSKCSHQIISNSTFGWWGAWLNRNDDKIVVAPKHWFPTQKGILPKDWKCL